MSGVADIGKFFDQLRRDLVFKICKAARMIEGVVLAYEAYIENLTCTIASLEE